MGDHLKQIEAATRDLVLTDDQLEKIQSLLLNEFNMGLGEKTNSKASVKMFPTYVHDVPNGREEGKFLALDLGGTNFRVLLIELDGDETPKMENEIFPIPQELMLGTGERLFDHIALCVSTFIQDMSRKLKQNLCHERLPLGFTFSFPCAQESLDKARLVTWTKGFKCSGVEDQDVAELLRIALKKRPEVDVEIVAVLNDTTGTLMSCAHKNRECRIALIVGTGSNACYMESLDKVGTLKNERDGPNQVIINTEWGAFGNNGCLDFLRTEWDKSADLVSVNAGKQIFEKMIGGMYMGELVRLCLMTLVDRQLIFNGKEIQKLTNRHAFETMFVSSIESDARGEYVKTRKTLAKLDLHEVSDDDCKAVQMVCRRISTRAAEMCSAAVSTILNRMQRPHTTVGVDGSVYKYHPHFHDLMEKKITELTKPDYKFDLMLSEDGSGRGAALVAAVAVRQDKKRTQAT